MLWTSLALRFRFLRADCVQGRQQRRDLIFQRRVELPSAVEFTLTRGFFHLSSGFQRRRVTEVPNRSLKRVRAVGEGHRITSGKRIADPAHHPWTVLAESFHDISQQLAIPAEPRE